MKGTKGIGKFKNAHNLGVPGIFQCQDIVYSSISCIKGMGACPSLDYIDSYFVADLCKKKNTKIKTKLRNNGKEAWLKTLDEVQKKERRKEWIRGNHKHILES